MSAATATKVEPPPEAPAPPASTAWGLDLGPLPEALHPAYVAHRKVQDVPRAVLLAEPASEPCGLTLVCGGFGGALDTLDAQHKAFVLTDTTLAWVVGQQTFPVCGSPPEVAEIPLSKLKQIKLFKLAKWYGRPSVKFQVFLKDEAPGSYTNEWSLVDVNYEQAAAFTDAVMQMQKVNRAGLSYDDWKKKDASRLRVGSGTQKGALEGAASKESVDEWKAEAPMQIQSVE